MKFFLLLSFIICSSCKSQSNLTTDQIFTQEIKAKISKIIYLDKGEPSDSYITHQINENERIIQLQYCGTCYLRKLMNQSQNELKLGDGRKIKILNRLDIENFKPNPSEEHMIITGGSYIIITDLKSNILQSYIQD